MMKSAAAYKDVIGIGRYCKSIAEMLRKLLYAAFNSGTVLKTGVTARVTAPCASVVGQAQDYPNQPHSVTVVTQDRAQVRWPLRSTRGSYQKCA